MALTNQPYLPLYFKDWCTEPKLKVCSAQARGVMIETMLQMHGSEDYGRLTLMGSFAIAKDVAKNKICYSTNEAVVSNFAGMIARFAGMTADETEAGLRELLSTGALILDGDTLVCPRMVKDAEVSKVRSESGKRGSDAKYGVSTGKKTKKNKGDFANGFANDFAIAKDVANSQQNTANANANENEVEVMGNAFDVDVDVEGVQGETEKGAIFGDMPPAGAIPRPDPTNARGVEISGKNGGILPLSSPNKAKRADFDCFWAAYPRKVDEINAWVAWQSVGVSVEVVVEGVERAKKEDPRFADIRYTPHPAKWLEERGWQNKFDKTGTKGGQDGGGTGRGVDINRGNYGQHGRRAGFDARERQKGFV